MTRGNLMIVLVLILALVGMFFWTLTLANNQSRLLGHQSAEDPRASGLDEGRVDRIEKSLRDLSTLVDSSRADISGLEGKVRSLEKTTAAQALRMANLTGEAITAEGAGTEGALRTAIEDVLGERQAEERRERLERMAEGWGRWILRDITATDDQKTRFVGVIASYLDGRDKVREQYSDREGDNRDRDLAYQTLETERNDRLMEIFGSDYAKIEEQLDAGRRFSGDARGARGGPSPRTQGGRGGVNRNR
jgi:hypothetical protein